MPPDDILLQAWGGLGDLLVCTPTIKALKERHPERRVVVLCRRPDHADLLRHNPYVDVVRLRTRPFVSNLMQRIDRRRGRQYFELKFQRIPLSWIYQKSVIDVVADMFGLTLTDRRVQLFFTPEEDEHARTLLAPHTNVVAMHINSYSSTNHLWQMDKWEALVASLPEYTFIQLGDRKDPPVRGAVDWRGTTTIREAFCVLKHADSFVGVDSVMAHATNAFQLPGVVLYGDSDPVQWGHRNNINVYKDLDCSPCYYVLWGTKCPYGQPCMTSITVDEVKHALVMQMDSQRARHISAGDSAATADGSIRPSGEYAGAGRAHA